MYSIKVKHCICIMYLVLLIEEGEGCIIFFDILYFIRVHLFSFFSSMYFGHFGYFGHQRTTFCDHWVRAFCPRFAILSKINLHQTFLNNF